ncbi:cadherin-like domain-containing protein, partial [Mesorhizobium yinganensis]|uniref:cadherin-like domain-containing protein n=1 Tax=Mesorhizobium yinganensis TaxID=3157707 RepID=UPI0032B83CA9
AIAEDGSRVITSAELLAGVSDVDGPAATITGVSIQSGNGSLADNGDGTWTYTPAANDDTSVTFGYTASDGSLSAASTASLDLTPVNDAPTAAPVDLGSIAENGSRVITAAELLAGISDVDGPKNQNLFASDSEPTLVSVDESSAIELGVRFTASADGSISGLRFYKGPDNTGPHVASLWSSTGELLATATFSDETESGWQQVSFSSPVSINAGETYVASYHTSGHYSADLHYFDDAQTEGQLSTPVGAGVFGYGSGSVFPDSTYNNANYWVDVVYNAPISIEDLTIASGNGSLVDNGDGTWTYTPAANDDSAVTFTYNASDGEYTVSSTASLDLTPVNDAPTAAPVDLGAIAEDGSRVITSAELLAGVSDVDGPAATITGVSIQSGNGSLADNGDGTWTYTPAANDDTSVTFGYTASDGSLSAASTASLDLTPVNDAPTAAPVDLGAIAEDGSRVITSAELLAGVSDVDGPAATITGVSIQSGNGSLADNGDGTWTYTPAANDDTSVTFGYTASDGSLSAASTASLDLTPVNDAPTAAPVDLGAIAEDGSRVITSAELLAGVSDVDGPAATITGVSIQSGNGSLADNGDGTWTYTPAANDDTSVTFGYTASDGSLSAASTASLDLTPVNDAPTAAPVDLGAIAEDGSRVITSAELLAGVSDVDGPAATITGVSIQSGNGSLADNGDGTWTYTPAANDDTSVTFGYTASDGSLSAASTASLDLTPVNDAP